MTPPRRPASEARTNIRRLGIEGMANFPTEFVGKGVKLHNKRGIKVAQHIRCQICTTRKVSNLRNEQGGKFAQQARCQICPPSKVSNLHNKPSVKSAQRAKGQACTASKPSVKIAQQVRCKNLHDTPSVKLSHPGKYHGVLHNIRTKECNVSTLTFGRRPLGLSAYQSKRP